MHPSALLSNISTREFFRNTREVHREVRGAAECFSHFSNVFKNSQVLTDYRGQVQRFSFFLLSKHEVKKPSPWPKKSHRYATCFRYFT